MRLTLEIQRGAILGRGKERGALSRAPDWAVRTVLKMLIWGVASDPLSQCLEMRSSKLNNPCRDPNAA